MVRGKLPPKFSRIHEDHPGGSRPQIVPVQPVPVESAPVETSRTALPPPVLRIVTWLWIALLIVGSLQPARPGVVTGHHHVIHWLAFAGGALLLFLLSRTRGQEILRALGIFFLGVSLEVLQHLIYRNPLEWRDVADDALAILLAFALYRLAGARKFRSKPRPQ